MLNELTESDIFVMRNLAEFRGILRVFIDIYDVAGSLCGSAEITGRNRNAEIDGALRFTGFYLLVRDKDGAADISAMYYKRPADEKISVGSVVFRLECIGGPVRNLNVEYACIPRNEYTEKFSGFEKLYHDRITLLRSEVGGFEIIKSASDDDGAEELQDQSDEKPCKEELFAMAEADAAVLGYFNSVPEVRQLQDELAQLISGEREITYEELLEKEERISAIVKNVSAVSSGYRESLLEFSNKLK